MLTPQSLLFRAPGNISGKLRPSAAGRGRGGCDWGPRKQGLGSKGQPGSPAQPSQAAALGVLPWGSCLGGPGTSRLSYGRSHTQRLGPGR